MNTRKMKIPEGWLVDKIVGDEIILKEKSYLFYNTWEKCFTKLTNSEMCYISPDSKIVGVTQWLTHESSNNVFPREYGEAMLALMKLLVCYKAWVGDWKPDFTDNTIKYCTVLYENDFIDQNTKFENHLFAFPDEKMRDNFFDIFGELFIIAQPLL
jgi:hypothetical protein